MIWPIHTPKIQSIFHPILESNNIGLTILRDDLLHPEISGNKWRKLKYHMLEAHDQGKKELVTMGGFHSNHILAVAAAGEKFGFRTKGYVQGYATQKASPTILRAQELGMHIELMNKSDFAQMKRQGKAHFIGEGTYFIPMGGDSALGIKGCAEIVADIPSTATHVAVSCGLGTTLTGVVTKLPPQMCALGFTPFKNGEFLAMEIDAKLQHYYPQQSFSFEMISQFNGGRFGQLKPEYAQFISEFYTNYGVPLDGVYNGKMMFELFALVRQNFFPRGSQIVMIHCGGIQGNAALNAKYGYELPVNH